MWCAARDNAFKLRPIKMSSKLIEQLVAVEKLLGAKAGWSFDSVHRTLEIKILML